MYLEFVNTPTRSAIAWRGIANALLGIIILVWPVATVYVVVLFFALNLISVGLYSIFEPLFDRTNPHSIMDVIVGVLSVVFGLYLIIKPEFAAGIIAVVLALWAILFGVLDIILASKARKLKLEFGWLFAFTGVISLLFGLYLILFPVAGILNITWLVGLYALVIGIMLLLSSILMKSTNKGVGNGKK